MILLAGLRESIRPFGRRPRSTAPTVAEFFRSCFQSRADHLIIWSSRSSIRCAHSTCYIINRGQNGLELLSVLITNTILAKRAVWGSGRQSPSILLMISVVPIVAYLSWAYGGCRHDGSGCETPSRRARSSADQTGSVVVTAFLLMVCALWLIPVSLVDLTHSAVCRYCGAC